MGTSYVLFLLFTLALLITLSSGRALSYDEFDSYDYEEDPSPDEYAIKDTPIDEPQRRSNLQRSILSDASQNRQQIIDLLRQAYSQGWKPNLKHYMPATRFGRHLR